MTKVADVDQVAAVLEVRDSVAIPEDERVGTLATGKQIFTRAAVQPVATCPAVQRVVATVATEPVVPVVAGEMVGMVVRPRDILDAGERVALGVPALPGAHGQVDGDARIGAPVADVIVALSAVERVRTCFAMERVVPVAAGEVVSVFRPDDILDAGERVALGVPALPRARRQVDGDACIGAPVTGEIVTLTAVDGVRTRISIEPVVPVVAGEVVGVVRPVDPLDAGERVALGVPALPRARRQVDGDARIGAPVQNPIVMTFAAVEPVRAGAAFQLVVTPRR